MAALPYPITPDPEPFQLEVPVERLNVGEFMFDRGWRGYWQYKMAVLFTGAMVREYERENGEGSWRSDGAFRLSWSGISEWAADLYERVSEEIQLAEFGAVQR